MAFEVELPCNDWVSHFLDLDDLHSEEVKNNVTGLNEYDNREDYHMIQELIDLSKEELVVSKEEGRHENVHEEYEAAQYIEVLEAPTLRLDHKRRQVVADEEVGVLAVLLLVGRTAGQRAALLTLHLPEALHHLLCILHLLDPCVGLLLIHVLNVGSIKVVAVRKLLLLPPELRSVVG